MENSFIWSNFPHPYCLAQVSKNEIELLKSAERSKPNEYYGSYILNFGKYKNKSLNKIWKIKGGRKYLGYIAHQDNIYDNVKNKIKKFMKLRTIYIKT